MECLKSQDDLVEAKELERFVSIHCQARCNRHRWDPYYLEFHRRRELPRHECCRNPFRNRIQHTHCCRMHIPHNHHCNLHPRNRMNRERSRRKVPPQGCILHHTVLLAQRYCCPYHPNNQSKPLSIQLRPSSKLELSSFLPLSIVFSVWPRLLCKPHNSTMRF